MSDQADPWVPCVGERVHVNDAMFGRGRGQVTDITENADGRWFAVDVFAAELSEDVSGALTTERRYYRLNDLSPWS